MVFADKIKPSCVCVWCACVCVCLISKSIKKQLTKPGASQHSHTATQGPSACDCSVGALCSLAQRRTKRETTVLLVKPSCSLTAPGLGDPSSELLLNRNSLWLPRSWLLTGVGHHPNQPQVGSFDHGARMLQGHTGSPEYGLHVGDVCTCPFLRSPFWGWFWCGVWRVRSELPSPLAPSVKRVLLRCQ